MVAPYLSFSGHGWQIGALRFGGKASDGSRTLLCWHPRASTTWYWSVSLHRGPVAWWPRSWRLLDPNRAGQWHDYYRLPFGRVLIVGHQDYHRRALDAREKAGLFIADPPFDAPDEFTDTFTQIAKGRD